MVGLALALAISWPSARTARTAGSSPASRWVEIAASLLARGRTEAAVAPLQSAQQADPQDLEATVLLAAVRLVLQEPDRALQVLSDVPSRLSLREQALVHTLRGQAYQRLGRLEPAVRAFGQAVQASPQAALAWLGLGQLARQVAADPSGAASSWPWPEPPASPTPRGYLELSERYLRRAAELAVEAVEPRLELARTQMELGRWQQALQSLQQANRQDPMRPETHYLLGMLYERQGRLNEAAAEYQRALELDPNHTAARMRLQRLRGLNPAP